MSKATHLLGSIIALTSAKCLSRDGLSPFVMLDLQWYQRIFKSNLYEIVSAADIDFKQSLSILMTYHLQLFCVDKVALLQLFDEA